MDAVGEGAAGLLETVGHRLVAVGECQPAVGAQTVGKAGHIGVVLALIEVLNEREVQRVDALAEDTHAAACGIGVIRARPAQADANLTVGEADLRVEELVHELFCVVHELLHLCLRPVEGAALRHIVGAQRDEEVVDSLKAVSGAVFLEVQAVCLGVPESVGLARQTGIAEVVLPLPAPASLVPPVAGASGADLSDLAVSVLLQQPVDLCGHLVAVHKGVAADTDVLADGLTQRVMHAHLNGLLLLLHHRDTVQPDDVHTEVRIGILGRVVETELIAGQRHAVGHTVEVFPALMPGEAVEEHGELPSLHAVPVGRRHDVAHIVSVLVDRQGFGHIVLVPLLDKGAGFREKQLTSQIRLAVDNELELRMDMGVVQLAAVPGGDIVTRCAQLTEGGCIVKVHRIGGEVESQDAHRHTETLAGRIEHNRDCFLLNTDPAVFVVVRHTEDFCRHANRPCLVVDFECATGKVDGVRVLLLFLLHFFIELCQIPLLDIGVPRFRSKEFARLALLPIHDDGHAGVHVRIPELTLIPPGDIEAVVSSLKKGTSSPSYQNSAAIF